MKRLSFRDRVLSLIGLGSLLACVLACVSFSPDDSKVLYPSFDTKTGRVAVSLYDRKSRHSRQVFAPPATKGAEVKNKDSNFLRPQWLPDGKSFLVAWPDPQTKGEEGSLNITVLPFESGEPAKSFLVTNVDGGQLFYPLALSGSSVFIKGTKNELIRLNLASGERVRRTVKGDLVFYPSTSKNLIYLGETAKDSKEASAGSLDPETFEQTEIMHFKETETAGFAIALDGKQVAFLPKDTNTVLFLRSGKPEVTLPLRTFAPPNFSYGNGAFSPKGDLLFAAFEHPDGTNTSYGFLEIPLDGGPIRQTTLIHNAKLTEGEDKSNVSLFQIGLSYDGQTLGVASTYLDPIEQKLVRSEDCALFLVDLSDPARKVTKIPIALPVKIEPKR
jgi:hypothetical protein